MSISPDILSILVGERNKAVQKVEQEINYYKKIYDNCFAQKQALQNELFYKNEQILNLQNTLNNTHNQLQNEINSKNGIQNELNEYKNNVSQLELRITSLENEIKEIRVKNQINNNKIVSLMDEVKESKLIIKATKGDDKLKESISIYFRSSYLIGDAKIVCYYHETFSEVEEKLYLQNPSLRTNNNIFLCDGKNIDKNKTLLSNEIIDGTIISVHDNSFI